MGRCRCTSYSYVIQSYDTAFSKKETADYSAITPGQYLTEVMNRTMKLYF